MLVTAERPTRSAAASLPPPPTTRTRASALRKGRRAGLGRVRASCNLCNIDGQANCSVGYHISFYCCL